MNSYRFFRCASRQASLFGWTSTLYSARRHSVMVLQASASVAITRMAFMRPSPSPRQRYGRAAGAAAAESGRCRAGNGWPENKVGVRAG